MDFFHHLTRRLVITLALVWVGVSCAAEPVEQPRGPLKRSPEFMQFAHDVENLNSLQKEERGSPSFVDVQEMGPGVVQLTAHKRWLESSIEDRQSSLSIMVNLWAMRSDNDTGVTLLIVDSRGIPVMKGSR